MKHKIPTVSPLIGRIYADARIAARRRLLRCIGFVGVIGLLVLIGLVWLVTP